jgi:hypothetical protein
MVSLLYLLHGFISCVTSEHILMDGEKTYMLYFGLTTSTEATTLKTLDWTKERVILIHLVQDRIISGPYKHGNECSTSSVV